jgi:geranylgeranyl diphosphate synthase type I
VGGTAEQALAAAVAVELTHNSCLIHDDVIDQDRLRHHRPTVWAAFGVASAVLLGDALLALAHQVVAEPGDGLAARSSAVLAEAVLEMAQGEADDVAFERRGSVTVAEYRAMAEAKTGAGLGVACYLGALAGGAEHDRARRLEQFGRAMGVAGQITDDLLGIFGETTRTGKPVGADIAARKKSYPVLAALADGSAAGRRLAELYAQRTPLDPAQVQKATALVDEAGGRLAAARAARAELEAALDALSAGRPGPSAKRQLAALAHLAVHRDA